MFWSVTSPLEADDEEWQLACWRWLLENFGGAATARARPLILPTGAFFRHPKAEGHAAALDWFAQVAGHFGIDANDFDLVAQDEAVDPVVGPMQVVVNAPASPAGTFSMAESGRLTISYDRRLLAQPMQLIATLAHELSHPLLLSVPEEPPGGAEMEEFATDLAVTFFGFGIFNSNTAAMFRQFSDAGTGTQGWSMDRQGYLSPAERAFALALFVHGRAEDERQARDHLEPGPLAYFKKAAKYLAAHPHIVLDLTDGSG